MTPCSHVITNTDPQEPKLEMKLLIKPFQEITIKSRPVRQAFMRQLGRNIRARLKSAVFNREVQIGRHILGSHQAEIAEHVHFNVQVLWDRVLVDIEDSLVTSQTYMALRRILETTPGIAFFQRVESFTYNDLQKMALHCAEHWQALVANKSFSIHCHRRGNHTFTSTQVETLAAEAILNLVPSARVNLSHPDIKLRLEIKQEVYHLEGERQRGLGGFPLGVLDHALALISGGYDSSVAAYEVIKRGVLTHFVFFNLGGRAHELNVMETAQHLWSSNADSHHILFISVPFEEVLSDILSQVTDAYMGVVLKRQMLKVSSRIAESLGIQTLVTGEAISQVSSQTLTNLRIIEQATPLLLLRPLITWHKQNIINTAEHIGTAERARHLPEYCGIISVNPTTQAKLDRTLHEESKLNADILTKAFTQRRQIRVDQCLSDAARDIKVEEIRHVLSTHCVIDIRPHANEKARFDIKPEQWIAIPFYQLQARWPKLSPEKEYLLYCDQGVLSQLHAHHLQLLGYANVRVFRPI